MSVWIPLAGDGYSATDQLQRTSCPSLPCSTATNCVQSTPHEHSCCIVVGIPLYRLIVNKCSRYIKKVQMLTKMWMGLYLSLVQVVFYIIVVINHDSKYWLQYSSVACFIDRDQHYRNTCNPEALCFKILSTTLVKQQTAQLVTPTCGSSFLGSSMVSPLSLSP